jgi:1-acyl-sn-glycerol-3-phosphate acyltransferase
VTESLGERWKRRAIVLPAYLLALILAVRLLPVLLPLALVIDLVRDRRLPTTRLLLLAVVYLACEVLGLAVSLILWLGALGNGERMLRWHYELQTLWGSALFAAMQALFGLRLEVTGDEVAARGPYLLFPRHVSMADTLLPVVLLARPYGMRFRWVLKRELLWDPCLDVVGQRLPNVFVRRGSDDSEREVAAVRDLARDLRPDEGVMIYPEGTRFTPGKRERAREIVTRSDPARAARLAGLRHLLPPRTGGPLALLDERPDLDVVFMAHAGLDGAVSPGDAWRGGLIGSTVHVAFWRVPAADIPHDRAERLGWLDGEWLRMDGWVGARLGGAPERAPAS